ARGERTRRRVLAEARGRQVVRGPPRRIRDKAQREPGGRGLRPPAAVVSSVEVKAPAAAPALEEPYVGLTYFTEDRADRFFGRGRESTVIISNLCAARLTLLYAESGVGKSSVLRAGVVARLHESAAERLRAGGGARLVPVVFGSWSERPVAALVAAIGEAIRPYLGQREAPELPEGDLAGALEAASEALGGTILVILDQF